MQSALTTSPTTCIASTSGRCSAALVFVCAFLCHACWDQEAPPSTRIVIYVADSTVKFVLQMRNTVQSEGRHLEAVSTPQVMQMAHEVLEMSMNSNAMRMQRTRSCVFLHYQLVQTICTGPSRLRASHRAEIFVIAAERHSSSELTSSLHQKTSQRG